MPLYQLEQVIIKTTSLVFTKLWKNKKKMCIDLLDLIKVFDMINHDIFLHKIKVIGTTGSVFSIMYFLLQK